MNTETCLHCAHADFDATKGSERREKALAAAQRQNARRQMARE